MGLEGLLDAGEGFGLLKGLGTLFDVFEGVSFGGRLLCDFLEDEFLRWFSKGIYHFYLLVLLFFLFLTLFPSSRVQYVYFGV